THVALESTGVYWKPIFNLLEGDFTVWVLNAQHVKNLPGRKTDVKDAEWLADLLRHGLVQPSFIPPQSQRDLRALTRERTNFVRQRATLINRVQKVLEGANLKLGDVASNVLGVSGRAILEAVVAGETDAKVLASLAVGKLRSKRTELEVALQGRVRPHHRFLLTELLCQIDSLEETIAHFDEEIRAACNADGNEEVISLLDTIPGVGRELAEMLVAEIGTDMSRFPTAGHLAAWAGIAPGNNESAGKRRPGKTRQGDVWLKVGLVQAARGAIHTKGTYLAAQYRRLVTRRGDKRALVAVSHSILVIAYHVILRKEAYRELGADYFERRKPEATAKRLARQIERLGFQVTLAPVATAA
ncbi:MAG: IS110 family transposase, partial [Chloroflexi bacterium]|nr:IS110 family transposase [Chloroflexota bacterium]